MRVVDDRLISVQPSPVFLCATCDQPLVDDPEDDPDGDAGLPICGDCYRAREFDAILEANDYERWYGEDEG